MEIKERRLKEWGLWHLRNDPEALWREIERMIAEDDEQERLGRIKSAEIRKRRGRTE